SYATRFQDLSNEVLCDVFEYLDMYDIYQGFFNLNNRFYCLLINSCLPLKINGSNISKSKLRSYHNDIIIPNQHRINIIRLSNPCIIDIFFSPEHFIVQFIRLETLILENIKSKYLENILNRLIFFI
ncbi:unnamed protein product, partial [Rotaria sordida]